MKISKYKIYDAGTSIGAEGAQFSAGKLEVGGTADASINWLGIPNRDIISVTKIAAVAADAKEKRSATVAGTVTAGDKYVLTISYGDTRQRVNKSFKYTAVSGDTATTVAVALKNLVNAAAIGFTATNASGVLSIENDTYGESFILSAGVTGVSTFSFTAVTVSAALRTDADYFESKYEGVNADDFGSATDDYIAYMIKYQSKVGTATVDGSEEQLAAIFIDGATTVTALEDALNSDWTPTATDGGAAVVTASKGKFDVLN